MKRVVLALVFVAAGALLSAQQGLPRDPLSALGAATIRGRVTEVESGAPLSRATVQLERRQAGVDPAAARIAVSTDAEGRYEFRDVLVGQYNISAFKTGYVALSFGQRRPGEPGRTVDLSGGHAPASVDFALPKGGVIAVRVVDERGEPIAAVDVQALQYRFIAGQRQLVPLGGTLSTSDTRTNEVGEARMYGLMPGEYFVKASGRSTINPMMRIGPALRGEVYPATYYPSSTSPAGAQPIVVGVGREVSVTLPVSPVRPARITGTVRRSDGSIPNGAAVTLEFVDGQTTGRTGTTWVQADGTFAIEDVLPGEHILTVASLSYVAGVPLAAGAPRAAAAAVTVSPSSPPPPATAQPGEYASMPLRVAGEDLAGLSIGLRRGSTLRGRIEFADREQGMGMGAGVPRIRLIGMPPVGVDIPRAVWNDDGTFTITGALGRGLFRLNDQPIWFLKSVKLDGQEVIDTPVEFSNGQEFRDLVVTVSLQQAAINGVVNDAGSKPLAEYAVVVFPDDRTLWAPHSRFVAAGRPNQQGRFRVAGLPAGRYLAAAIDYLEVGGEGDPSLLRQLAEKATRIDLAEGESKGVTLTLVRD